MTKRRVVAVLLLLATILRAAPSASRSAWTATGWHEVGEASRDGKTWHKFLEMTLERQPQIEAAQSR